MNPMEIVWLAAVIVFGILESVTVQFVSIWFAGGALLALIAALLGANAPTQSVIFVVASALLLLLTRPLVKKLVASGGFKSNTDSLIGKTAVITRSSDAFGEGGEAKVSANCWSVKSADGAALLKDEVVTVERIEGVKLIVKK